MAKRTTLRTAAKKDEIALAMVNNPGYTEHAVLSYALTHCGLPSLADGSHKMPTFQEKEVKPRKPSKRTIAAIESKKELQTRLDSIMQGVDAREYVTNSERRLAAIRKAAEQVAEDKATISALLKRSEKEETKKSRKDLRKIKVYE